MKKEYLDSFLDKSEQDLIGQFADNEKMFGAVRKILLAGAYNAGVLLKGKPIDPLQNFALSIACMKGAKPEDIGKDVKACWEAINALEVAFNDMRLYKSEKFVLPKVNPAR